MYQCNVNSNIDVRAHSLNMRCRCAPEVTSAEGQQGAEEEDNGGMKDKENDEEMPALELPDTPELPSPGVEYSSLPDNTIKQLVDKLTALVYSRVQQ